MRLNLLKLTAFFLAIALGFPGRLPKARGSEVQKSVQVTLTVLPKSVLNIEEPIPRDRVVIHLSSNEEAKWSIQLNADPLVSSRKENLKSPQNLYRYSLSQTGSSSGSDIPVPMVLTTVYSPEKIGRHTSEPDLKLEISAPKDRLQKSRTSLSRLNVVLMDMF